jgi:hypothetical protein
MLRLRVKEQFSRIETMFRCLGWVAEGQDFCKVLG